MTQRSSWLLSAYHADSHAAWTNWLQAALPEMGWHALTLPGRHFRWRIRGNPLSWLDQLPDHRPGLILATSMVDLATLRGLHPRLAGVPTLLYFHENQFAYPVSESQARCIEPQMVQLYAALAADRLLFNSGFNRDTFLAGVDELLRKMPDQVPRGVADRLRHKAQVLPVPIPANGAGEAKRDDRLVVWNHRWDYDKAPEVFADAMVELATSGVDFRLALLGPRPAQVPAALGRLRECCGARIVVDAKLGDADYREILGRAGIVVSSARHEFQGLAVMQAVAAGCRPLLPDDLCYPEQYPALYRYPAGNAPALARRLADWLRNGLPEPADVGAWSERELLPQWRSLLYGMPGG